MGIEESMNCVCVREKERYIRFWGILKGCIRPLSVLSLASWAVLSSRLQLPEPQVRQMVKAAHANHFILI